MARPNKQPNQQPPLHIFLPALVFTCATWAAASGCTEDPNFERQARERGTFGQELFSILHEDLTRAPDPGPQKATAFNDRRDGFVWAVDTLLSDARLDAVDLLLKRALPDIESGLMPGLIRKTSSMMDALADDTTLLELMLSSRPIEYLSQPERLQMFDYVMRSPRLTPLFDLVLAMASENDGRDGRSDLMAVMLSEATIAMRDMTPDTDPDKFLSVAVRLLLTEDPTFKPTATYEPHYVIKLDGRGLPTVRRNDIGSLPSPFTDTDSDGLPDAANGWFVDRDGQPLAAVTPFGAPNEDLGNGLSRDAQGFVIARAFEGTVFEYVDLHATLLSYVLREARPMMRDDLPFDLVDALKPVLGARQSLTDGRGTYQGYSGENQLVGLVRGLLVAIDNDDVPALLEGTQELLKSHPNQLAGILRALENASDALDRHPNDIADSSTAVDALLGVFLEITEVPGLLEDVLAALSAPTARAMPSAMTRLMNSRAGFIEVEKDGPYDACYLGCKGQFNIGTLERMQCIQACPSDEIFQAVMDQDAPGTLENRSLFERALGIIWEAAGQEYNVRFIQFRFNSLELINVTDVIGDAMMIDNMALTYLKALTGRLALSDVLNPMLIELAVPLGLDNTDVAGVMVWVCEEILDLEMSAYPDPGQLTRLFNKRPLGRIDENVAVELNMAICRSGKLCIDAHADALYAAEASGLIDALHPLAMAFDKHDRLDLLLKLFDLVYTYYPSESTRDVDGEGQPIAAITPDNLRSLEPALLEILGEQDLLSRAADLGDTARGLMRDFAADRSLFVSALEGTLRHILTPDASLRLVTGEDSVPDNAGNPISPMRPLDILLDPLDKLDAQIDADPTASAAWDRAVDRILDLVLEREDDPVTGEARFKNQAGLTIAVLAVAELRDRWLLLEADGDRSESLRTEYPDSIAEVFGSRWLPLGFDMLAWIDKTPDARSELRQAMLYMLQDDETSNNQALPEQMVLMAYTLLRELLDDQRLVTLANHVAPLMDPARVWTTTLPTDSRPLWLHAIDTLNSLNAKDPERLVMDLLRDAVLLADADGHSPGWWLGETLAETHRPQPGQGSDLTAADAAHMMREINAYLRDDRRGFERAVELVTFVLSSGGGPSRELQSASQAP